MSYDNNGGCCGGGFGNMMGLGFEALILLLFFGLMGGGMWGGWGGMGGFGGGFQQATTTAAETAALVGQQQVADRVAGIATGVDAVAGLVTAQGTKLETVKDAVTNGFFAEQTQICQLGNNISQQFNAAAMNGMQNQNALVALLNDMRAENAKRCCESRYQSAADKCEVLGAISASESRILAQLNADKFERMQDKLNAANERNAELKARIDNGNQTQTLLAAIQANGCKPACTPAPCGSAYAYTPCNPCNPCFDGVQRAVNNALGERIGELLFPTTTPAQAAG